MDGCFTEGFSGRSINTAASVKMNAVDEIDWMDGYENHKKLISPSLQSFSDSAGAIKAVVVIDAPAQVRSNSLRGLSGPLRWS